MGTRDFHQDLKIGESTFAEVYRGRRGNESFAVKVFKQVLWTTILTIYTHIHTYILYIHMHAHTHFNLDTQIMKGAIVQVRCIIQRDIMLVLHGESISLV